MLQGMLKRRNKNNLLPPPRDAQSRKQIRARGKYPLPPAAVKDFFTTHHQFEKNPSTDSIRIAQNQIL